MEGMREKKLSRCSTLVRYWEDLSDDCWETILSYLDREHGRLLRPVSLVSKRFKKLSDRIRTILNLPFPGDIQPTDLYTRFPNITSLNIPRPYRDFDGQLRQLAAANLPLRSLRINHQFEFPVDAMRVLGRSSLRRTLTSLTCNYFYVITDNDLFLLAHEFSYLRHLDLGLLNDDMLITDDGVRAVSAGLASLLSLTIWCGPQVSAHSISVLASNCPLLSFFKARINDECSVCLHDFASFASLSSLCLCRVTISEPGLDQLAGADLKLCKLSLVRPRCMADVTGAAICRFFRSCRSLSQLWLRDFELPSDTLSLDFAASIPNVKQFDVRNCGNLPKSILFDLLKACPNVEEINLLETFAAGDVQGSIDLPVCHRMRKLWLAGWGLTDETLVLMGSICPKLELFFANHCSHITKRGVEAIRESCRNIEDLQVNNCENVSCSGRCEKRKREGKSHGC